MRTKEACCGKPLSENYRMGYGAFRKGRINEKVFLRYVLRLLYIAFFRMLIKAYFL